jgi:hypothetical protein
VASLSDATKRAICGAALLLQVPFREILPSGRLAICLSKNSKCDQTGVSEIVVDSGPVAVDKYDQTGGRLGHMIDETTCLLRRVAL